VAGVRVFGLTHAGNNEGLIRRDRRETRRLSTMGWSLLGKQCRWEVNELGIIIDVSQLTPEGLKQVIALSKAPVIAKSLRCTCARG